MPTFEITHNKQTYEIDAPDQKSAIDALSKYTQPTVGEDVKSGAMDWTAKGIISALLPGEGALNLAGMAIDKFAPNHPMMNDPRFKEAEKKGKEGADYLKSIGVSNSPTNILKSNFPYEARTPAGKYVQTGMEMLPGAIGFGASNAREIPKAAVNFGLLPAATSETVGNLPGIKGTQLEPWAKAGTAFATSGVASVLNRPSTGVQTISRDLGGLTEDQLRPIVSQAKGLIDDAASKGINLTWAQAIEQVAPGSTNLPKLQRYIERTEQGANALKPFYQNQPQAIQGAIEDTVSQIAPRSATPSAIGPAASQEAQTVLRDVEGAINRHTRPLYNAAEPNQAVAPMSESYQAALRQIRGNPELNATIAHLPDDSVGVSDLVRRHLQAQAQAGANSPYANDRLLASIRGNAGNEIENSVTRQSPAYAQAQAEQALARQQYLNPLEQGPLGGVSRADSTQGAINAVFPKNPLAGSENEVSTTISALGRNNPTIPQNLVAQYLRNTADQQVKQNIGGPNYYGGARFAKEIAGTPQSEANLFSATRALPAGNNVTDEVSRLLDALRATGKRLPEGSQTSTDILKDQTLKAANDLRLTPQRAVDFGRDMYQTWRVKKAAEQTADILQNPEAAAILLQAASSKQANPLAAILMNTLAQAQQ